MLEKFKSRKFLTMLFAQIVGLIVLFFPEHADEITAAATNITALIFMGLMGVGWIAAEGKVDAARAQGEAEATKTHQLSEAAKKTSILLLVCFVSVGCAYLDNDVPSELVIDHLDNLHDPLIDKAEQALILDGDQLTDYRNDSTVLRLEAEAGDGVAPESIDEHLDDRHDPLIALSMSAGVLTPPASDTYVETSASLRRAADAAKGAAPVQ